MNCMCIIATPTVTSIFTFFFKLYQLCFITSCYERYLIFCILLNSLMMSSGFSKESPVGFWHLLDT